MNELHIIAHAMVARKKGILAADESTVTIGKRFAKINVENTEENRRAYRELLCTAPNMNEYISGVIMYDETLRQKTKDDMPFVKLLAENDVISGIKVDQGTEPMPDSQNELITKGLEGLPERLKEYYALGARFAKWRAVITIGEHIPTSACIKTNAERLAHYAKMCQNAGIVPIVEPEVLMDGAHTILRCYKVTREVLLAVFEELKKNGVALDGMILKPNMVIAGSESTEPSSAKEVAEMTIKCLKETVPSAVMGIAFLSGGQSETQACETLNEINKIAQDCPWQLTYSYGRALQSSALQAWEGKTENIHSAQDAFLKQARLTSLAREGILHA